MRDPLCSELFRGRRGVEREARLRPHARRSLAGCALALHDRGRPGPAAERVHGPRGHGVPAGRDPLGVRVVDRLDVDPAVGQIAVDVEVEPRGGAGAVHAETDQRVDLVDCHREPGGPGLTPRRHTDAIAVERTDVAHQFATETLTLPLPTLPAESLTVTVSVVGPFGPVVVFHGSDAGRSPLVDVDTVWPLALIVYVLLPAAALSAQITSHCVPRTVPPVGCVIETLIDPVGA